VGPFWERRLVPQGGKKGEGGGGELNRVAHSLLLLLSGAQVRLVPVLTQVSILKVCPKSLTLSGFGTFVWLEHSYKYPDTSSRKGAKLPLRGRAGRVKEK